MTGAGRSSAGLVAMLPLLRAPRYEVLPTAGIRADVLAWVPRELTIAVTASPARGLQATVELTEQLRADGYRVVPHLSARLVRDEAHLADIVARLLAAGVDDVFVPAGDADPPAGRFHSALSLIEQLVAMGRPFSRIGITGYPQSHPKIVDDVTVQAMWDKRQYAAYIVSNLCFDPVALQRWIARVRARGVTLPMLVGIAGPSEPARLMRMAARAGLPDSARFVTGHADWLIRLGAPGGYRPDRLLDRAGRTLAKPESAVAGLHMFTFNQLRQTETWRTSLLQRLSSCPPLP